MTAAESVCVSTLKKSGLNFTLTETPFSVTIVLKKSFIRRRDSNTSIRKSQEHNVDTAGPGLSTP